MCHSYQKIVVLAWIFSIVASATSLKDLDKSIDANGGVGTLVSNPAQWRVYERELKNYLGEENTQCQKLEDARKTLIELRGKLPHFRERLARPSGGEVLHYEDRENHVTYDLRKIEHPFNALWLYPMRNECQFSLCNERDDLLVERWTSSLIGTQNFVLEKNGKYTGTTVSVVPVQKHKSRALFIIPLEVSGTFSSVIGKNPKGPQLGEAILRDLAKNFANQQLFVVRGKNANAKGFSAFELGADGKVLGTVTNLEEYRLADPAASTIGASITKNCQGGRNVAGAEDKASNTALDVGADGAGGSAIGGGGGTGAGMKIAINNGVGGSGKSGAAGAAGNSVGAKFGKNELGGKGFPGQQTATNSESAAETAGKPALMGPPPLQQTMPSANAYGNRTLGDQLRGFNTVNPSVANSGNGGNFGTGNGNHPTYTPPSHSGESSGSSLNGFGGTGFTGGMPGGNTIVQNSPGADAGGKISGNASNLSPSDKQIMQELSALRDKVKDGFSLGRRDLDPVQKGLIDGKSKEVRDAAKETYSKAYFEQGSDPENFKKSISEAQGWEKGRAEELRKFLSDTKEICEHCGGCEYCQRVRTSLLPRKFRLESSFSFFSEWLELPALARTTSTSTDHDQPVPSTTRDSNRYINSDNQPNPFHQKKFTRCMDAKSQPSDATLFYAWVESLSNSTLFKPALGAGPGVSCRLVRTDENQNVIQLLNKTAPGEEDKVNFTAIDGGRLGKGYEAGIKYCLWGSTLELPSWVPCPCRLQEMVDDQYAGTKVSEFSSFLNSLLKSNLKTRPKSEELVEEIEAQ